MLSPEAAKSSAVPSMPPPPTLSTRGEETRGEERRRDETRGDKRKQEETRRGDKSLYHPSKVNDILGESWSTNYLIVTRELNTLLQCEFGRPARAQNIRYCTGYLLLLFCCVWMPAGARPKYSVPRVRRTIREIKNIQLWDLIRWHTYHQINKW